MPPPVTMDTRPSSRRGMWCVSALQGSYWPRSGRIWRSAFASGQTTRRSPACHCTTRISEPTCRPVSGSRWKCPKSVCTPSCVAVLRTASSSAVPASRRQHAARTEGGENLIHPCTDECGGPPRASEQNSSRRKLVLECAGHQQRVTDSDAVGGSGDVARRIRRGVQLEAELATGRGRPAGDLVAEAGGAVQQAHATNVAVLGGNGPQYLVEIRGGWSEDVQHVAEGWATQPRRGSAVVPDYPPCGL